MADDDNLLKKPSQAKHIGEIDPKYLPPRPTDDPNAIVSDDSATITWMLNYAHNMEKAEEEAKREPIRRAEEQKHIQRVEQQRKEQRERELQAAKRLPEVQFRSFADGNRYTCGYCHVGLRYEAVCKNPNCPAHSSVSIEPLMAKLRKFVNDYYYNSSKGKEE